MKKLNLIILTIIVLNVKPKHIYPPRHFSDENQFRQYLKENDAEKSHYQLTKPTKNIR